MKCYLNFMLPAAAVYRVEAVVCKAIFVCHSVILTLQGYSMLINPIHINIIKTFLYFFIDLLARN